MKQLKKQRQSNARRKNNGNPDKIKGQGFHTNPERINKKGRPRKLWKDIANDLRANGVVNITESEIVDTYSALLQATDDELKKILKAPSTPKMFKIVIKHIGGRRDIEMLDRILDRSFGRVMQRQQIDSTVTLAPEPGEKTIDQAALLKEVQARLDDEDKK